MKRNIFLRGVLVMQLSSFQIEDQYSKAPDWKAIAAVPTVMVLAGEKAAEDASRWGVWLQKSLNGDFVPSKDHLRVLDQKEKVKVIAVATLPEVPGMFKGLFRRGFRSKTEMGMLLDFGSALSSSLHYKEDSLDPAIAILPSKARALEEAQVFMGASSNEALRRDILESLQRHLKQF